MTLCSERFAQCGRETDSADGHARPHSGGAQKQRHGIRPIVKTAVLKTVPLLDTQPAASAKDSTAKLGLIIDAGSWALRGSVQPIADLPHDASPIRRLQRRRASDYEPP